METVATENPNTTIEGYNSEGEKPEPAESRKKSVVEWTKKIQKAKKDTWKDVFKMMRHAMDFLSGNQWGNDRTSHEKYIANIVQRHVQQRTAALYAKNPRFVAKRRETLDFKIWDGDSASLQVLQSQLMITDPMTGQTMPNPQPPPQATELVTDISSGIEKRKLYDKIARTLELLMKYYTDEQQPPFKRQMKQLVRRACACAVGYIKIGFQRQMEMKPENVAKVSDITEKLALAERLMKEATTDKSMEYKAEADQLKTILKDLQDASMIIINEGLTFDFPGATSIIIDPKCKHLSSFLGARWVAEEFILDLDDVKEIYKVDISSNYTAYKASDDATAENNNPGGDKAKKCCVWEVWDKKAKQVFTIAEGYCDFLREPAAPNISIKRFWPFFPLCFNETENDNKIYPQSDVELLMPMQREINRSREGLREHRIANRPKTCSPKGALDPEDRKNLQCQEAFAHIEIGAITPGQKMSDILQAMPNTPISSDLYDIEIFRSDAQAVAGQSDAGIGNAQSGVTATGDSIAESNRASFNGSVIDEMDDMLSELAKAAGEILFLEMSIESVQKIVGPGAAWPQLTAQQVSEDLILTVQAGSSGRPNKAAEVDNFNKLAPTIMQIPGISPEWLAKQAIKRLDDGIDISEAIASGIPSMIAMNSAKQPATGNAATDPNMQGPQGAANGAPKPQAAVGPGDHNMMPGATIAAQ